MELNTHPTRMLRVSLALRSFAGHALMFTVDLLEARARRFDMLRRQR